MVRRPLKAIALKDYIVKYESHPLVFFLYIRLLTVALTELRNLSAAPAVSSADCIPPGGCWTTQLCVGDPAWLIRPVPFGFFHLPRPLVATLRQESFGATTTRGRSELPYKSNQNDDHSCNCGCSQGCELENGLDEVRASVFFNCWGTLS